MEKATLAALVIVIGSFSLFIGSAIGHAFTQMARILTGSF